MTLGDIIKEYRQAHSLSMEEFSRYSGLSKAYISLLEKNKHPKTGKPIISSLYTIRRVAAAMAMSFDEIFSKLDSDTLVEINENGPGLIDKIEYSIKPQPHKSAYNLVVEQISSFSDKQLQTLSLYVEKILEAKQVLKEGAEELSDVLGSDENAK